MSSGGWEKVGGSKGNKTKPGGKFTKTEKKNFAERAPKLEDVLSMDQITGAYTSIIPSTPTQKSPKKEKKVNNNINNNQQNGNKGQKPTKKPNQEQVKVAKNIEEAAKKLSNSDLQDLLANVKTYYPQQYILWIKDVASYLNNVLNAETGVNLSNPFATHPLAVLTKETKKILAELYESCNESGREGAFANLLANLAHDMAKGSHSHGNIILLQHMSEIYPSMSVTMIPRAQELLKSYRNRVNIGTAILWAMGQGGRKDFSNGLKVWIELISDHLQLKNYSRFVVDYLTGLINCHRSKVVNKGRRGVITNDQYFKLFDIIFVNGALLSKDLSSALASEYPTIKKLSVDNCEVDHDLFPQFLRLLKDALETNKSNAYRDELLRSLTDCLANNKAGLSHWHQMFTSFLPASAVLLGHLGREWTNLPRSLKANRAFVNSITAFEKHLETAPTRKQGVSEARSAVEVLRSKMSRQTQRKGWFSWRLRSLFLAVLIYYLVSRDIKEHNGFEKSKTGLFLKDIGLDECAKSSYNYVVQRVEQVTKWGDANVPVVRQKANQLWDLSLPYIDKANVLVGQGTTWMTEKSNLALEKAEASIPGFKEKLFVAWQGAKNAFFIGLGYVAQWSKVALTYVVAGAKVAYAYIAQLVQQLTDGTIKWDELWKKFMQNVDWAMQELAKVWAKIVQQVQQWLK